MTEHTSNSNLPYPDGSDGPDGPGGIAALAEALDIHFLPVTIGSGYTNPDGNTEAVALTRFVIVNLSLTRSSGTVSGNDLLATLPSAYSPASTILLPAAMDNAGSWIPVTLFLGSDGAIRVTAPTATGTKVAGSFTFRTGP